MREKTIRFLHQETVLCAALLLAALSMLIVPPDTAYIAYIDFRTLAILFCLMCVMAGLQKIGIFRYIAEALLSRVKKIQHLVLILVLLCFFSGMLITNDVALITFVPFTFIILRAIGEEKKEKLLAPVVVLQTIAANMGSMMTPIGNPQNLYLYGKSGISLGAFIGLMLPYTLLALLLLLLSCIMQTRGEGIPVEVSFEEAAPFPGKSRGMLALYGFLFFLALLTVAKQIPYEATLAITIVALLCADKSIFTQVDYGLLLTFIGFFIFIGNMGRLPLFYGFLQETVSDHELFISIATSQIISNVPAALLLSGFTDDLAQLIVGINLGGLGTLIASMASLISYKQVIREDITFKGIYFRSFTLASLGFLSILLPFAIVWA